ncbi:MAG: carbohydrate ABC transporter permease [Clostridiales bacterium]|jgi:putative aldouronate transport system permease protein|nr:carbohydrate ABC transporter permease [Clostridiales bacterium]
MKKKGPFASAPNEIAFRAAVCAITAVILLLTAYPLYYVLIASVSSQQHVMAGRVYFLPMGFTLEGYAELAGDGAILRGYANTVFYALAGTALGMAVTTPCAYALSRRDFWARRWLMVFFLVTMFFSGGMIPTYLAITKTLGMGSGSLVMIVPFCLNVFNLIILRTYFETNLPRELWESAQLDGCSNARYFAVVALPLSKAVLSVIMLYFLVGKWNDYFSGLLYIRDEKYLPLQNVLRSILTRTEAMAGQFQSGTNIEALHRANLIKFSSIVASSMPMMALYPFLQKYFEKGVMIGSVKG